MTKTLQIIGIILLSVVILIGAASIATTEDTEDSSVLQTFPTSPF